MPSIDIRFNQTEAAALKVIPLFAELPSFRTDYSIGIKLTDFIAILSDIVLFTEFLKPSDSPLVIIDGGIFISSTFKVSMSNVQIVLISILKHLLRK